MPSTTGTTTLRDAVSALRAELRALRAAIEALTAAVSEAEGRDAPPPAVAAPLAAGGGAPNPWFPESFRGRSGGSR